MAKEEVGVAIGAVLADIKIEGRNACLSQLVANGGVKVKLPVTGARGSEHADSLPVFGRKAIVDCFIHFVAVRPDAGANGNQAILRLCAEMLPHGFQCVNRNAPCRAAPTGMSKTNCFVNGVKKENGQAIRYRNAEQKSGRICYQRVTLRNSGIRQKRPASRIVCVYNCHIRAMRLRGYNEFLRFKTQCAAGGNPFIAHVLIILRDAERQIVFGCSASSQRNAVTNTRIRMSEVTGTSKIKRLSEGYLPGILLLCCDIARIRHSEPML